MALLLANIFVAKTCLVVLFPCLYAAWPGGNSASNLCIIRFFKQIAKFFLNMDSKVIGLRFSIGSFGLPGF